MKSCCLGNHNWTAWIHHAYYGNWETRLCLRCYKMEDRRWKGEELDNITTYKERKSKNTVMDNFTRRQFRYADSNPNYFSWDVEEMLLLQAKISFDAGLADGILLQKSIDKA